MPELAPEAPGPEQQQRDHEHRQDEEAHQPGDVEAAAVEAVEGDRLERDVVDADAVAHDRLALLPALDHRLHGRGCGVACLLGQLVGVGRIRDEERADHRGGERALVGRQVAADTIGDARPHGRQLAVAELSALEGGEDARRLGAHGLPALGRQRQERAAVGGAEGAEGTGEDRLSAEVADAGGEGRVHDRGLLLEGAGLLGGDRGRTRCRVVVLGLHRNPGGVLRLAGEDVADVLVGARRLDHRGRRHAQLERRLRGQEVHAQDRGHGGDQEHGRRQQPPGIAARELGAGLDGGGEHGGPGRG